MATVFAVSVPGCSYVRPELVPATGTYTSSALCAAYLPLHKKSPTSALLGRKRKSPRRIFQSRYQLRIRLLFLNSVHFFVRFSVTVEPRSTDTRLIRTPALYGQFRLSRQKAHIFSLKLTRFIRTPVNTDNGHFSVSRVTNSHILSTLLYGHWLSTHCLFS